MDLLYLDFRKAFDAIFDDVLIDKLKKYRLGEYITS